MRSILRHCGAHADVTLGRSGKAKLLEHVEAYNNAAAGSPWLVLVDLDSDFDACPVDALAKWLPHGAQPNFCFRIAVREIEAWLLADADALAAFLAVPVAQIPGEPESLEDPKRALVDLARQSRKRAIREGMVPRDGSGTSIGPTYVSDLNDFASNYWRPQIAARSAGSLDRCLGRLQQLVAAHAHLDDGVSRP